MPLGGIANILELGKKQGFSAVVRPVRRYLCYCRKKTLSLVRREGTEYRGIALARVARELEALTKQPN